MRRTLISVLSAACLLIGLALPAGSAEDYVFSFEYGKYNLAMPTSLAPEVKYYIDGAGGEYKWQMDNAGDLYWVFGMSRPIEDGEWHYTFEGCKEIERDETETLKVGETRWKYSAADVVLNIDESELTYVDIWCTRKAFKHILRFSFARSEDHEALAKEVKDHMKKLEWWN